MHRNTDNSVHTTSHRMQPTTKAKTLAAAYCDVLLSGFRKKKVQQKRNIKATRKSESINYIFNPARHKKMCLVSSFYMFAKIRPQVTLPSPTPPS